MMRFLKEKSTFYFKKGTTENVEGTCVLNTPGSAGLWWYFIDIEICSGF